MSWDFRTDDEYQEKLDWADGFVRERIEPLDLVLKDPLDFTDPFRNEVVPELQADVKEQGLWAAHLGPELGGQGFGQLKLALLNEILGQSRCAPAVFGCQAPDSGNAEILAAYGSPELKARYLQPLLDGHIASCFSMTEPQGGSDPAVFTTMAALDGDEWVIDGEKWFSSGFDRASFLIVMAVTDPDQPVKSRSSMFVVPRDTPGLELIRSVGVVGRPGEGVHGYVRYRGVRVPADHILGPRGGAFAVAQTRLGGGRIHHAMRTVGAARRALDMLCERALSRTTKGDQLANKQMVQEMVADSWIELEQFRLLVMRTAWKIDEVKDYRVVRGDIAAVKILLPKVMGEIARRAIQVHGALGVSDEMPLVGMLVNGITLGIADGPTEVHKVTLARQVLSRYQPAPGLFPTAHVPARRQAALERYDEALRRHGRLATAEE
jgi:acyl-CoA dehydrogenase